MVFCKGRTRQGKRCRRSVGKNAEYCYLHKSSEEKITHQSRGSTKKQTPSDNQKQTKRSNKNTRSDVDNETKDDPSTTHAVNDEPGPNDKQQGGEMCTDVYLNDDVPVKDFIMDNPDDWITIDRGPKKYCLVKENLMLPDEPEYLRCLYTNKDGNYIQKSPVYKKVRVDMHPALIRKSDIQQLVRSKNHAWELKPVLNRRKNTVFKVTEKTDDYISSAHCQEGTDEVLYQLVKAG